MSDAPPDLAGRPTRERLIRAALHLFQARGYHAVGLAEVLTLAGAPKGSLYHHFPGGKAALGAAVIDWLADEVEVTFRRAEARALPAPALAQRLFTGTADWLETGGWRQGALLAIMAHELAPGDPALTACIARAYARARTALEAALRAGGVAETAAPDLAVTLLALLDGCVAQARAFQSRAPFEAAARSFAAALATAQPTRR